MPSSTHGKQITMVWLRLDALVAAAVYSPSPGFYDTQYADRTHPDCRGRLHTAKDGSFGYRAVVPRAYPIPSDVSVPFGFSDPSGILIVD